ncbi:MAG: hypothetical protein R6X12_09890, partial [bacterium]
MRTHRAWRMALGVLLPIVLQAQTENWVYRLAGPGGSSDVATSIHYGADGNIYAAGYVCGEGVNQAITVVSLTSAGDTNWVYRHDVPTTIDRANSIAYGADGNIYVAGTSGSDFTVISLSPAGGTNWVYRCTSSTEANSLVYGADGNIYAAGSCGGCFGVISLTQTGDTNWTYRYVREGFRGSALPLVFGDDGNIYAAGSIGYYFPALSWFCVVSLTTAGDTNWVREVYLGQSSATSLVYGDGNVYAAGVGYSWPLVGVFVVASLTAAGSTNWVYLYDAPGGREDHATSIAYGADGNVYAAGTTYDSVAERRGFTVISLMSSGDTNWVYWYSPTRIGGDFAHSIVCGEDCNIYAGGYSIGDGTYGDLTVISLRTAGDTNWTYRYDGPGSFNDAAYSVAYGADGRVYAAGYSGGLGTGLDFTVVSLNPVLGVNEDVADAGQARPGPTIARGVLFVGRELLADSR